MTSTKPLEGIGLLVTRPEPQAQALSKLIEAAGGHATIFSTIVINETDNRQEAIKALKQIPSCDWLFFISANAVNYAAKLLGGSLNIPPQTKLAAIGGATQKALIELGLKVDLTPQNSSHSEALLAQLDLLNMNKKKCMIIRGEGGRETLMQALKERGAETFYAEVYRRSCSESETNQLISSWKNGAIDYVIVTSGETLKNLITLLGDANQKLLRQTPLLTVSKRIEKMAYNAGIKRVIISKHPYNETLIETLIEQTG